MIRGKTENLSQTGMLLKMPAPVDITDLEGKNVTLDFRLHEGDLQEGTEMHYRRLKAKIVRVLEAKHCIAIQFNQPLYEARKRTDRILFLLSRRISFNIAKRLYITSLLCSLFFLSK